MILQRKTKDIYYIKIITNNFKFVKTFFIQIKTQKLSVEFKRFKNFIKLKTL